MAGVLLPIGDTCKNIDQSLPWKGSLVDAQFQARYQNHRRLIERCHPQLFSCLPPQWPESFFPALASEKDQYRPISLEPIGGHFSRRPRYAVVFGMGSGVWLLDFYRTNQDAFHTLVILEPAAIRFACLMGCSAWTALLNDTRVHWYVGENLARCKDLLLRASVEIGAWGIHAWAHDRTAELYPAIHTFFLETIEFAQRGAKENTQVLVDCGFLIQYNILRNLPIILRSSDPVVCENLFPGVPAVIVGAGPSLSRNLEALCHAPPNVLLIATDTALRVLLRQGIQPHFVVACDPQKLNDRHFEGIESLGPAVLAYLPDVNAKILQRFVNHKRLLCLHDYQSQLLHALAAPLGWRGKFFRRMNVGLCAFMLARSLGCSPIILAGMDLAVTPGGLSHAQGTANASTVETLQDGRSVRLRGNLESGAMPLLPVPGYWGDTVYTFTHFYHCLRIFEQTISEMDTPVIDATEGGALKKGAIQMSLQEALSHHPGKTALWDRLHGFSVKNPSNIQHVLRLLKENETGLRAIERQLHRGMAQLAEWRERVARDKPSLATIQEQVRMFLTHWQAILKHPAVDTGIDIGLARWRFAAWRAEPPEDLSPDELAAWWQEQFQPWFTGLLHDLQIFIDLYVIVLHQVQNILTSGGETQ